jgi:uncharacterized protein (DUF4213/DUF364 family)
MVNKIELPGTLDNSLPWSFYNEIIDEIPGELLVRDVCVGLYWTYVEAEDVDGRRSMGVAYTMSGGGKAHIDRDLVGTPLAELAQLSKSWNWREASIGVAALNAWHTTYDHVISLGGLFDATHDNRNDSDSGDAAPELGSARRSSGKRKYKAEKTDPFHFLKEDYMGKKITVVGHFPWLDEVAKVAELTILERDCREGNDTPDPACEYIIPTQDYLLMTGVTIINKTAPRLIALAENAVTVMLGPSVIASENILNRGVDILAGRVVVDNIRAKEAVKQDLSFGSSLQMYAIDRREDHYLLQ